MEQSNTEEAGVMAGAMVQRVSVGAMLGRSQCLQQCWTLLVQHLLMLLPLSPCVLCPLGGGEAEQEAAVSPRPPSTESPSCLWKDTPAASSVSTVTPMLLPPLELSARVCRPSAL